jgi:hypothetical protein
MIILIFILHSGDTTKIQTIMHYSTSFIVEAALYSVLILVAKGWGVTRQTLTRSEKQSLIGNLA